MEAEKQEYKKGLWTEEEDTLLLDYVRLHGTRLWNRIPKLTGLRRCGKSCRLRWLNYLSPNVKKGDFSQEEDDLIIRLHNLLGNRWSLIAGRVPGRTDNQVKNHWNTHLSKKPTTTPTSKRRRLSVSNSTSRPSRHVNASNNIITDLQTTEVVVGNTRNQNLGNGGSIDQEVPPFMGNCLPSLFSDDYSYFMNFTHVPQSIITVGNECLDSELDLIWKGF